MRRPKLILALTLTGALAALAAVALAQPWQPEYPEPSHWEGVVRPDFHLAWGEHHYQLLVPCLPNPGTACPPNTFWTYQLVPLTKEAGVTIKQAAFCPLVNPNNQCWANIDGFWVALGAPGHDGTIFVREIKLSLPPDGVPVRWGGGRYFFY